ncbi:Uma2 family endonuclease [Fulvivirgaceae bacterium PWU20]|uniref:Uma2 family endonuclease n=1 Tax=Chryseosolibacter indicus TaxID=2782351 RepID=A0ABS5VTY5_9BACT|nr:Uma2 family endonuclease [Chryseosolibacter indicus]
MDEHSNAVQPDIIFVFSENISIIKDDAIHGIPDLLIEILSPGNSLHDTVKKKELYQKFGVKEYWVIDPETTESTGYTLKNGIYIECGRYKAMIKSLLLNQEFNF